MKLGRAYIKEICKDDQSESFLVAIRLADVELCGHTAYGLVREGDDNNVLSVAETI